MPSICTVPSLLRPPREVKKIMSGAMPLLAVPLAWMPETVASRLPYPRDAGSAATTASSRTRCTRVLFCTSTTGVSPVTVIVSCSPPTRMSVLSVTVTPVVISTASRFTVLKPGSV